MTQNCKSNSSISPSSQSFQKKYHNKIEEQNTKNFARASLSSTENQHDQEETIRNIVHKVEIDSEGIIQEKTYKQVIDQQVQRENHLKNLQNKYRQNPIKVEDNEDENYLKQIKSAHFQANSNDDVNNSNLLQGKSKTQQEQQLNYSYVSFDDNGENFMTNQTDEQSEFNTKQSYNLKNKFSSISSTSTGIYQKKIDEVQQQLKEKISFLIALEEELLETKTQLNMQKLENSSHKERINKLQKDNHLMQKQITQMGETIKNLEKASNSLVNQILLIKNNNEMNNSKEHQSSLNNLNDSTINPLATYQEYLNDIVKSNINLRISLEELNQKYGQLKNQINSTVYTHSSPVSTKTQNLQFDTNLSTNNYRSRFLKDNQDSVEGGRKSVSPSNISSSKSRASMSPMQGGMNVVDFEKSLIYSKQQAQYSLQGKVREIKEACDKFVYKYIKNKRRNCTDEKEKQFYVELDNELLLINNNIQKMESYLEEVKFENESRVKNAREQFEITLKEIEQIKKIAEERNKILIDQVKQIEQQNVSLNKTVENYKGSLMENEKGLDESRLKLESYQKTAEDYQNMLRQANETLSQKNDELIQMKKYRENLERDLNEKVQNIKELKLENNENSQFIRKLQEQIIALQQEMSEKQETLSKTQEFVQQLKEESEKKVNSIQRDNYQVQNKEKEFLEKEIKFKERENQLLNELSQRDQIISNLQDQINEINQSHLINKIESENECLKTELDNLKQIKSEFENNFNILQTQITALKSENKELKNDEVERKLLNYEKYLQLEQKLGLQQTDILLLVEKLPLAEQELQTIVALNDKLQNEINKLKQEKGDSEKGQKDWKSKFEKSSQEIKHIQEQFNQERDLLKENIKQQIQMNQQLQKQNQTIMKNCELTKQGQVNLETQVKNLTEENELLSQKCIKLEDCLQLLVKERELIKKQQGDAKLKELSNSEYNVIQSLSSTSVRQLNTKTNIKNDTKDKLRISTSKDKLRISTSKDNSGLAERIQTSVSPSNSRSSKQSLKMSKNQLPSNSNLNNNANQTNNSKQINQQSTNNLSKVKQTQPNQNLSNSIQSQSSVKSYNNTNRSQSQLTSSQQIKQMQQFHAMQGIQQHQLASLSPMSQQKYQQNNNLSVQSNQSGKNNHLALQSISPKNILQSQELKSKHVTEKENNFSMPQEQSIKISQLIQSNQLNNNNSLIQSIQGNVFTPGRSSSNLNTSQNLFNTQNLVNSQNLRQSNQTNNCEYARENSQRIQIPNQSNNYQQDDHDDQNKYIQENEHFVESRTIFTNRVAEKPNYSQNEDCKMSSDEGYSNNMYTVNFYEDSNQQWKIKSLRDNPYEIVKKSDKNVNQTFAEADQYEDFEEKPDLDQIQNQQKERFEREMNLREQEQRELLQNQFNIQQYQNKNTNLIQDTEQNQIWNEQQNKQTFQQKDMFENSSETNTLQQQQQQQSYEQISKIHEGFSFNNEIQRGKFMFQQQLNNINFSDEAFQTEQYSFN